MSYSQLPSNTRQIGYRSRAEKLIQCGLSRYSQHLRYTPRVLALNEFDVLSVSQRSH